MHRSILTGLCVCVFSAGLTAVGGAAEVDTQSAPVVATTTVTSASDIAAPTAGADLAMWNTSTNNDDAVATPDRPHLGSFLHVQKFASGIASRGAAMASALTRNAMRFLGVPYAFGGTSRHGFDCSGYVQHVFAMMGHRLPRTADAQYFAAKPIAGKPRAGDLVFFQTYEPGVSHVGISLGGDRFVSASSSHGVSISSLHSSYWGPRYLGAKRVVE